MTHDEVTAAMKAEDVDAALVEKASDALSMLRHGIPGEYSDHTRTEVRHALAAVLPEIQAQALREREGLRDEVEAFRDDLTALREGLMERIGRYTPSDADLLAYVDALKAQVDTQEPAGQPDAGSAGKTTPADHWEHQRPWHVVEVAEPPTKDAP